MTRAVYNARIMQKNYKQFTLTFAKVNVSVRNGTYKLKTNIARLVMETELQNKHREKRQERIFEVLTYCYYNFIGYSIQHLVTADKYSS